MAQDNTPAIVMYKGPQEDGYSIPFDKGYYGEVKVAFVRRGLTDYEYDPTTYTVDGALYAWEVSAGVYYYTKSAAPAADAEVYDYGNKKISGVTVTSTQNASASFSDGKTGIRSNKRDIHSHALLFWTGKPLGNNDWICIVRETVKKQPYSYPNNQKHIEGALDNLSRQIQELKAQSDVSLKIDPTFVQDPQKMNPIMWLNTIVRSTDTTARGLRYRNFWLEYSTDDPNKAESDKSWTKLLNTTNITSVREFYNEETGERIPQYSKDGGATWKSLATSAGTYTKEEVDNQFAVVNSGIQGNADAIQKTREDYISADSEIHHILNNHASELTTLRGNQASLGDQVAGIEQKIPESASGSNPLITKHQLLEEEMDIREDMNQSDSELQAQITAQAAAIATLDSEKLDKNQGDINAGKYLIVGNDGNIELTTSGGGGGGGIGVVNHDETLTGNGTDANPLKVSKKLSLEKVSISDGTRDVLSAMSTNMARELFPDQTFFGEGTTITSQWALDNPDINYLEFLTPIMFHGWMPDVAEDIAMKPISAWSLVSGYQVLENFVSFTTTSSQTMAGPLVLPELTVETPEGALNISVTAGVATIATNNGLDIASPTKFDTAPTTDDNTTWENALDTSLVRKAQVAAAIGSAASITIRNWQ